MVFIAVLQPPRPALVMLQVLTLLLHQHRSQEAAAHFRQHVAHFRQVPSQLAPLPPAAAAAQQAWICRQHAVMGELVSTRVDPAHLPPQASRLLLQCHVEECGCI